MVGVMVRRMGNQVLAAAVRLTAKSLAFGLMVSVAMGASAHETGAPLAGGPAIVSAASTTRTSPDAPLRAPQGEVILTVTGAISQTNATSAAGPVAELDATLLESFGLTRFTTQTVWTDGSHRFEGVDLARLLAVLGAKGSALRLTALNDYAVEVPISEAVPGGPMLALRMADVALSPRDKGPLWMVYPYDHKPEYRNEISYSRSIWQVFRIEVLP